MHKQRNPFLGRRAIPLLPAAQFNGAIRQKYEARPAKTGNQIFRMGREQRQKAFFHARSFAQVVGQTLSNPQNRILLDKMAESAEIPLDERNRSAQHVADRTGFPAAAPPVGPRRHPPPRDRRLHSMIQGLRTAIYHAPDLARARDWYASVLGFAPYFDQPFYVGFNVGGFELGLDPDPTGTPGGNAGAIVYWGVADADAAWQRLLDLGATRRTDVQEVGEGIRVATVLDPFGNIFGIIQNPHFSLPVL